MSPSDLVRSGLVALAVVSVVPAYDRVLVTGEWRLPALTAALAALVIATVVRGLGAGTLTAGLVSAAGFVALVPVLAGLVPRPSWPDAALRTEVWDLVAQGLVDLDITPAPAPLLASFVLLLVAGFWVVAHVAHELLVRWSRTGPGLIVLAALWAVPLVVPVTDTAWVRRAIPFLAVAVVVLLVTTESRLPRPGLASAGAAMGAVAIVAAATLTGLLPGFGADAWYGLGAGSDGPRGYQPIVDVSNRLQQPEEREVLRVRASQRTYLRLAGLDTFDGHTWRLGPASAGSYRPDPSTLFATDDLLPPEVPARATEPVFVDIEVRDLANIYVPVPYQPVQVLGPFRDEMVWSTDGGFLATWDTQDGVLAEDGPRVGVREGVTYRVQAERPVPTREQLLDTEVDTATVERFTQLPREYPELQALAEQVYAEADATSTVDRALALQAWFTGPEGDFTYDLDVPALRGDDALERFVTEDRTGYCEYFAASMATMLRATGIPARVATGFLPGERIGGASDSGDGEQELAEYSVTSADAHAWVEVLFPEYGWIMFEPTPRSDGTQIQPRADELSPLENERERRARELAERADELDDDAAPDPSDPPDALPEEDPADESVTGSDDATGANDGAVVPVLLASLLVLVVAGASMLARRGGPRDAHDPRARILAAQRRLHAAAVGYDVARRPDETSLELARRWRGEHRVGQDAERFAEIAQAAAFGGEVTADMATEAQRLQEQLIAALRRSVDPTTRRTARLRGPWHRAQQRGRQLVNAGDRHD